jgi:hypothetical protein
MCGVDFLAEEAQKDYYGVPRPTAVVAVAT